MKRSTGDGAALPRCILLAALPVVLMAGCSPQRPVDLGAGNYLSPLVQLQRLQGGSDHLHVDEVRLRDDGMLLQCSYTFGVVDARDAAGMRYLAQGLRHEIPDDQRRPGCIHLAAAGDDVYTTHRGNIRNPAFLSGWDISDPRAPVQLPVLQEPEISYEGIDTAGGYLFVGLHEQGLGVYRRTDAGGFERLGIATGLTNAWGVSARGTTVLVADGGGGLAVVDAGDPAAPVVRGRVATGGSATGVVVDGEVAYVAAGSAGLVVVNVADPDNPVILGGAPTPGSAVRVDYSEGHVFVAAWNDARVYDVADPAAPRLIAAARLTRAGAGAGCRPATAHLAHPRHRGARQRRVRRQLARAALVSAVPRAPRAATAARRDGVADGLRPGGGR